MQGSISQKGLTEKQDHYDLNQKTKKWVEVVKEGGKEGDAEVQELGTGDKCCTVGELGPQNHRPGSQGPALPPTD